MPPTDLDEEIREALGAAEEPPEEPLPAPRGRSWWASRDWWLRTAATAAGGRIVGALLTGAGLLLAWLVARALT
jgi:chemotaxis response regulator CheB